MKRRLCLTALFDLNPAEAHQPKPKVTFKNNTRLVSHVTTIYPSTIYTAYLYEDPQGEL